MATVTQDAPKRVEGSPAPKYVTRKVGPLECRFVADRALPDGKRPANCDPVPTVESLALAAQKHLPYTGGIPEADRRKRLLDQKATRNAAAAAVGVEHLRDPEGHSYGKAALGPLVTVVRKQLVADLRAAFKKRDAAAREADRVEQRYRALTAKAREAAQAKAARACRAAVLPEGSRPSKAVSKDATRPHMQAAHLTREGDVWQLVATDSYQACVFELTVHGDAGLRDCVIPNEAIKAIEKSGAFRIEKGQIVPLQISSANERLEVKGVPGYQYATLPIARVDGSTRYAFDPPGVASNGMRPLRVSDDGRKPRVRKGQAQPITLAPAPTPTKRMEMTFNAQLLAQIAAALNSGDKGLVTIEFDADSFVKGEDGVRRWGLEGRTIRGQRYSPTIRVKSRTGTGRGHLMPVRPNV